MMYAGMNANTEVSFSKNSWTFELRLSVQVCQKKRKFILCVPKLQIELATVPIQRQIKFNARPCGAYESGLDFAPKHFNPVPSFPSYEVAFIRFFGFRFTFWFGFLRFTITIVKQLRYQMISLHLDTVSITLCYIRSAVVFLGLPA